jgi:hypothetical protein
MSANVPGRTSVGCFNASPLGDQQEESSHISFGQATGVISRLAES